MPAPSLSWPRVCARESRSIPGDGSGRPGSRWWPARRSCTARSWDERSRGGGCRDAMPTTWHALRSSSPKSRGRFSWNSLLAKRKPTGAPTLGEGTKTLAARSSIRASPNWRGIRGPPAGTFATRGFPSRTGRTRDRDVPSMDEATVPTSVDERRRGRPESFGGSGAATAESASGSCPRAVSDPRRTRGASRGSERDRRPATASPRPRDGPSPRARRTFPGIPGPRRAAAPSRSAAPSFAEPRRADRPDLVTADTSRPAPSSSAGDETVDSPNGLRDATGIAPRFSDPRAEKPGADPRPERA